LTNPTKVVFTLATTNTDGTVLAASAVTGVKYEISAAGSVVASATVAASDLGLDVAGNGAFNLPKLNPGSYSLVLYTESVSQGSAQESVASTPVPFSIEAIPSIPNPPVAVSVV
jgi:hypothetical protein